MPIQEATLPERLAFRFFELVRSKGLSTSWCRGLSGRRVTFDHVNSIMERRLDAFLESGLVKPPREVDPNQLDMGFPRRRNRQTWCSTVRTLRRREFPKARQYGEVISPEEIASITMSFACFMTVEGVGEVRYPEPLNHLRRLVIRQLRAMSYVVDDKVASQEPVWTSCNLMAKGLCSWSCLARVDGLGPIAVEVAISPRRQAS
jgi:hypothetical protein